MTWIYLLKNKSSVTTVFPEFLRFIHTQYKYNIKAIRTDNAPELAFTDLLKANGIKHYFSCPYTPQQNSVVERKHQHILNVTRAHLFQSKVPLLYWGECIQTAIYLINRTPSPLLQNKSPYELLTTKILSYDHLRVFGCLCYSSTLQKDRNKFTPRANPCVFLGYPHGYKGYRILDTTTNKIIISRNVVFHETIFPYATDPHSLDLEKSLFDQDVLPMHVPDSSFFAFFDLGTDVPSSVFVDESTTFPDPSHMPSTSSSVPHTSSVSNNDDTIIPSNTSNIHHPSSANIPIRNSSLLSTSSIPNEPSGVSNNETRSKR